jgi:hypothetical protein
MGNLLSLDPSIHQRGADPQEMGSYLDRDPRLVADFSPLAHRAPILMLSFDRKAAAGSGLAAFSREFATRRDDLRTWVSSPRG